MRHFLLFLLVFLTISSCNNDKKEEIVTIEDNNTELNVSRVNPDGSITYEYIEFGTKDTVGTKTTKVLRTITYYESVTDTFRRKYRGVVVSPPPTGEDPPPPTGGTRSNLVVDLGFDGSNPFDPNKMYKQACCSYSITQSKTIVRSGDGSMRAEVKGSDPQVSGGYRAEFIVQDQSKALADGWYGYSVYFENWNACNQCGEHSPQWHPDGNGSANLGIYTNKNTLNVQLNPEGDESAVSLKNTLPITSNKWYDVVWHVKWAASGGRIELWIDGNKYVDFTGATLTKGAIPYFKLGINRWSISGVNRVEYFDNIRIGNEKATYKDVAP